MSPSSYSDLSGTAGGGREGGGGAGRAVVLPLLILGLLILEMARKFKVNGEALTSNTVCIGYIFLTLRLPL